MIFANCGSRLPLIALKMIAKPMKKATVTLLAALLLTSISTAQNEGRAARFGIKLAPNMGWVKPDVKDLKGAGATIGYTFGLMGDFMLGENGNYAFATGLLLNNIGGKFTYPSSVAGVKDLESSVKLRYIEVPITLKLKTNEIGYMTYYGQLGVSAGFNIRAKADIETLDLNNDVVLMEDEDVADDVSLFKAALVVGAGFEFNFSGNTSLLVGVTYNGGFTNLYDGFEYTDVNGNKTKVKATANYIELSLGVFF